MRKRFKFIIKQVLSSLLGIPVAMLISVFDLWILIDRRQFIAEAPAGTIPVKIIQIQEFPVPSLLKENPLLQNMS